MSLKLLRSISSQNLNTTLSDIESKLEKLNLKLLENKFYQTNRILFTNSAHKSTLALFSTSSDDSGSEGKSSSSSSNDSSPGESCTSSSSEMGSKLAQPAKKKMVRFADTLGFELVTVRVVSNHVLSDGSYWSKCQSDEDEDSYEDECFLSSEEEACDVRQCLKSTSQQTLNKSASQSQTCGTNSTLPLTSTANLVFKKRESDPSPDTFTFDNLVFTWRCLFEQPGISPDFFTRLNDKKVSLESIYSNHFKLNGIVRVINLAFVKHVFIRYTINNWTSYNDLDCSYLLNGTNDDKLTDRFMFTVLLDKNSLISTLNDNSNTNKTSQCTNKQPMLKLEFAICYQISFDAPSESPAANRSFGQSYWDNNHTNNYQYDCYFKIN